MVNGADTTVTQNRGLRRDHVHGQLSSVAVTAGATLSIRVGSTRNPTDAACGGRRASRSSEPL